MDWGSRGGLFFNKKPFNLHPALVGLGFPEAFFTRNASSARSFENTPTAGTGNRGPDRHGDRSRSQPHPRPPPPPRAGDEGPTHTHMSNPETGRRPQPAPPTSAPQPRRGRGPPQPATASRGRRDHTVLARTRGEAARGAAALPAGSPARSRPEPSWGSGDPAAPTTPAGPQLGPPVAEAGCDGRCPPPSQDSGPL